VSQNKVQRRGFCVYGAESSGSATAVVSKLHVMVLPQLRKYFIGALRFYILL
jgi:hypothetical protein